MCCMPGSHCLAQLPFPHATQAFDILGNSGIGTVGAGVNSAPVVLGGNTDAALAQGQAAQQAQGQPLVTASG